MNKQIPLLMLAAILPAFAASAFGAETNRSRGIREALERFHADPAAEMESVPPKWEADGSPVSSEESLFSAEATENRDYVLFKGRNEHPAAPDSVHRLSPIEYDEDAERIADVVKYRSLAEIEGASLTSAKLEETPWSGDYWSIQGGILARRYADPAFPNSGNWKENSDYVLTRLNSSSIETLSPAEKYDLLVGDLGFTLTKAMLKEGETYYTRYGTVESWMGICHGWAPASYMVPRPVQTVQLLAADGRTKIPFLPTDIKALVTLLWAKVEYASKFAAGRCNDKNPKKDENGRVLDQVCFDQNPGAWHLSVVNQVGVSRRAFVIDATFDYQVWNQPVHAYQYTYFNPQTGTESPLFTASAVPVEQYARDKFRKYRSVRARSIVGVAMDVTYAVETPPSTDATDSPDKDRHRTVRYLYDLELDEDGMIIGGEWYTNPHPDFLWNPHRGAGPRALGDYEIDHADLDSRWDGRAGIPEWWKRHAAFSSRFGQPLAHVLDTMVILSRLSF